MTATPLVHFSDTILWRVLLTIGVVNGALGLVLLFWPDATLTVVVFLVGIELLVSGVLRVLYAAGHRELDARLLRVLLGLVAVVLGLLVMREPLRSIAVLVAVLGVFWVLWGCIELFVALTPAARGARGYLLAEGAVAAVAGMILLAWPEPTLRVLALVAGGFLALVGLVTVATAWRLRDLEIGPDTELLAA